MVAALKCDKCKQFVEEGHSLLYKFVGFYSDDRENGQASMLNNYDLCDECLDIVQSEFEEILNKK